VDPAGTSWKTRLRSSIDGPGDDGDTTATSSQEVLVTVRPHTDSTPTLLQFPASTHAVLLTASGRRAFARYAGVLHADAELHDAQDPAAIREALRQVLVVLATAEPAAQLPDDGSRVELGEWVELTTSRGTESYLVVDPVEAVLGGDRIAVTSALGQALVGRRVGDHITLPDPQRSGVVSRVWRDA
jgi:transcription elongation GreA/GreB family factor